jgi:hypothetical protein
VNHTLVLRRLYVVNATLLVVHEIDSAFWREWDLFGLPAGEAGFLAIHLPLVALVVWGYGRTAEGARAGAVLSLLLAAAGLLAAALHAAFLLRGAPEFRAPASIALLVAILVVSLAQAPLAVAALRGPAAPTTRVGA